MPKLRLGKGAVVSCLINKLHPKKLIHDKYLNIVANARLTGGVVLRQEVKKVCRVDQLCTVFTHEDFPNEELHVVARWAKVDKEGPESELFNPLTDGVAVEVATASGEDLPDVNAVTSEIRTNLADTVVIDDDNVPAPENVPTPGMTTTECQYGEWGHDGCCHRRMKGAQCLKAKLKTNCGMDRPSLLSIYEACIPVEYIKNVIIPKTNRMLDHHMDYGEYLQYDGTLKLMATTFFSNKREFWSSAPVSKFQGAPFQFVPEEGDMTGNRFGAITYALAYAASSYPAYRDRFWEVREYIKAWNDNMADMFCPSFMTCLDESMSKSLNQYTTPGFIVCPRKPWPFGNEYHTIACCMSGVLFRMELVEGKDEPVERPAKAYSDKGKTVGLLLRLTESIWGSGRIVILDSGFCVLKGLIELRKRGVYASALIKKRRYWPKYVDGDAIAHHFEAKEVGAADALPGVLDGVPFHIYALKEPDYVLTLMSTYGTMETFGEEKKRGPIRFKYPEVVHNHYTYRDAVDNNNKCRMYPIAIEESNKTTRWENRVHNFLTAVSETNARCAAHKIFGYDDLSQIEFRRRLAKELIHNPYRQRQEAVIRVSPRKRLLKVVHGLCHIPAGKTFQHGRLVNCAGKYNQWKCYGCPARVRTYCKCIPGHILCEDCWVKHIFDAATDGQV